MATDERGTLNGYSKARHGDEDGFLRVRGGMEMQQNQPGNQATLLPSNSAFGRIVGVGTFLPIGYGLQKARDGANATSTQDVWEERMGGNAHITAASQCIG